MTRGPRLPRGPSAWYAAPVRSAGVALTCLGGLLLAACEGAEPSLPDAGPRLDAGPELAWVTESGVPTREDLLGVWGRSADDVWAVGWRGTVIHWDGRLWRLETTTATVPLTAIHGLRPDPEADPEAQEDAPIFAVGWNGTILTRSRDGRWAPAARTATASQHLFGVAVGGRGTALAVGDQGRVWGYDGEAWSPVDFQIQGELSGELIAPRPVLQAVWTLNGRRYYFVGSGGAAFRSADGFRRFEALDTRGSEPLRGVFGFAHDHVYAVGLDGLILRYTNQWRRVVSDGADRLPRTFLFGVAGRGPDELTVVGWRGVAAHFDGESWARQGTGTDRDLRAIWVDPETGAAFAVGAGGLVLRRAPPPPEALPEE